MSSTKSFQYFLRMAVAPICLLHLSCVSAPEVKVAPAAGVTTIKRVGPKKLRAYSEHLLSNGLRVVLIKDDSLPLVGYHLVAKSGFARDPAGAEGTAQMVASLLERGTQKRSASQIADDLAQIGGDFDAAVDADYTYVSASGLSLNREKLLENFSELLTKPSFQDAEIERLRKQFLDRQIQMVDNASSFASAAFQEFLMSPHPYGRSALGKKKSVSGIKKANITRFYLEHIRPSNSIMAVVGDFSGTVLADLESAFKDWKPRAAKPATFEPVPVISGLKFRLVNKPEMTQSQIRMGHEGIQRTNKDFLAVRVANLILGQGFTSRLVDHIRDNLGLTYSISSDMEAMLSTGSFEISTFTRTEKTGEAIAEILKTYKKFFDEGVKPEEVESAKGFLAGGFGRTLETAERLAFNLLVLRIYGVPDTYLSNFESNVEDVSVSDVNRVIKMYFRPDQMKVLILANQSLVEPQLKTWAPIEVKSPKDLL